MKARVLEGQADLFEIGVLAQSAQPVPGTSRSISGRAVEASRRRS